MKKVIAGIVGGMSLFLLCQTTVSALLYLERKDAQDPSARYEEQLGLHPMPSETENGFWQKKIPWEIQAETQKNQRQWQQRAKNLLAAETGKTVDRQNQVSHIQAQIDQASDAEPSRKTLDASQDGFCFKLLFLLACIVFLFPFLYKKGKWLSFLER